MTMRKLLPVLVLLTACGGGTPAADTTAVGVDSRTVFTEPSAAIDPAWGRILGVGAGMPRDSLVAVFGPPLRERADPTDSTGALFLEFPAGTVRLRPSAGVVGFLCGGDDCRTAENVGIGDSTDVLLSTYGPTPPRGPVESPEAFDYRIGDGGCNLTFTLASGRVTSVELACVGR
jgi:hypothetical protein